MNSKFFPTRPTLTLDTPVIVLGLSGPLSPDAGGVSVKRKSTETSRGVRCTGAKETAPALAVRTRAAAASLGRSPPRAHAPKSRLYRASPARSTYMAGSYSAKIASISASVAGRIHVPSSESRSAVWVAGLFTGTRPFSVPSKTGGTRQDMSTSCE